MNAELALVAILRANSEAMSRFEGRIYPQFINKGSAYPCLVYARVGGSHVSSGQMATQDPDACDIRIQLTAWSPDYLEAKQLTEVARTALRRWRGTIDEIVVWDVQLAGDGPDLYDSELGVHGASVDYMFSQPKS